MKPLPIPQRPWMVVFLGWIAFAAPTFGQAWDPFPPLSPGSRLALAPGIDPYPYQGTDRCLTQSRSGAQFFAAVVGISDAGGRSSSQHSNAVPYVDALYQVWRRTGRLSSLSHVLIVVSTRNRGVAVHPGTQWADLGFEGRAVTRVIDNSRFGGFARSGEPGEAVCALAQDIDQTLSRLASQKQSQTGRIVDQLRALSEQRDRLAAQVIELSSGSPQWAARWSSSLQQAEDDLAEGRRAASRNRLSSAESSRREAADALEDIEREIGEVQRAQETLNSLRATLSQRQKQLREASGSDSGDFQRARRQFLECSTQADSVEASLLAAESASTRSLERCIQAYDGALEDAVARHRLRTTVLPAVVGSALLLLLLTILVVQGLRIRWARRQARALIDQWRGRLDRMADKLLQVETRHPLYFRPEFRRWTGHSHDLDRQCAESVNRVYWAYSQANLLVDRAEQALAELRWRRFRDLDRPVSLLTETDIQSTGEDTGSPLRLSGASAAALSCKAAGLLEEIDRLYDQLESRLRAVTEIAERYWELLKEADEAAAKANEACQIRADLDSSTDPLSEALEPILDRRTDAMALSEDPVAANAIFEQVIPDLEAFLERAESGNRTLEALRGPAWDLHQSLEERLVTLRQNGFRLQEPGFAPDLRLARGLRQAEEIELAVAGGAEDRAEDQLQALKRGYQQLAAQLDTIERTRETLPARVNTMDSDVEQLRERLPRAHQILGRLENEHHPDTFAVEADNLNELESVLESFSEWGSQIRKDFEAQNYLAAAEDLATGTDLILRGRSLLDGLGTIEKTLADTRKRAQDTASVCLARAEELKAIVGQPGIPNELRLRAETSMSEMEGELAETREPLPHWPDLESALGRRSSDLDGLHRQCLSQIADLNQAKRTAREIEARFERLTHDVRLELRDRAHVAEAVESVKGDLGEWTGAIERVESGDADRGGSDLVQQGLTVRSRLDWAADVWRSEMDLIRLAESKLAAARHRLESERGHYYGHGVSPSLGEAERLWAHANQLRNERRWQEVLEASQRLTESVVEEAARCRREADRREAEERRRREAQRLARQREERRRRQAAAREAARIAAAAVSTWADSRSSASSFGGRPSGGRPSRGRPPGGFGKKKRKGKKRKKSRGGSSFGGSRSGGSGW